MTQRYVHGPGEGDPLIWYDYTVLGYRRGLFTDHQGSIVASATSTAIRWRSTNMTNGAYRPPATRAGSNIPARPGCPTSGSIITRPGCTRAGWGGSCRRIPLGI